MSIGLSPKPIAAPPVAAVQPPVPPTFGERLGSSFAASVADVASVGDAFLQALARALPWLLLFGIPSVSSWLVVRIYRRRATVPTPSGAQPQPAAS